MNISIIANRKKEGVHAYADTVLHFLREHGVSARLFVTETYTREELAGSDYLITLGGDGTILRAAGILQGEVIPILGINVGHLGYLAEVMEMEQIPGALSALLASRYELDKRAMLYGEIIRNGCRIEKGLALNEILLSRQVGINMLHFSVFCDGQELMNYAADGFIVSTPTGSTAYNLSAGGPIVSPMAPVYVMTPICSHSLNGRAVVMDDSSILEIHVESDSQVAAFDGWKLCPLEQGDLVRIRKAGERTTLLRIGRRSFMKILRDKMKPV